MAGFFSYDSKFSQGLSKFVDIVVLSFLWIIFCIPIVTAGTSTTALFTSVRQVLREDKGYTYRSFWGAFKSNFKHVTPIWLIQLAVFIVLFLDYTISRSFLAAQGSSLGLLYIVFFFLMLYEIVWMIYTYAYASRFEQDRKSILKNAAILSLTHLPWSALMLGMLIGAALLTSWLGPFFLFIFPALYGWIFTIILERIFRRYMTPEDLKKVEEEERLNKEKK